VRAIPAIILAILAHGPTAATAQTPDFDLAAVPVVGTSAVDPTAFNRAAEAALADGATWPTEPLALVHEFLYFGWSDREVTALELKLEPSSAEAPRRITVTAIRDGFLDDRVRGDWQRLELVRRDDGRWEVASCRRAERDWAGEFADRFGPTGG